MKYRFFSLTLALLLAVSTVYGAQSTNKVKPASKPYLGIGYQNNDDGRIELTSITKNSGADKASLKAGDVLITLDDKDVVSSDDVVQCITTHKVGDKVRIVLLRDRKEITVYASLGAKPKEQMLERQLRSLGCSKGSASFEDNLEKYSFSPSISNDVKKYIQLFTQRIHTTEDEIGNPCERLRELHGTALLGIWVDEFHQGSVRITGTIPSTGAEEAGLQSGDAISEIDGKRVTNYKECVATIQAHKPGDIVSLKYARNGEELQASARLVSTGDTKKELVSKLEARCIEKSAQEVVSKGEKVDVNTAVSSSQNMDKQSDDTQKEVRQSSEQNTQLEVSTNDNSTILTLTPNPATSVVNLRYAGSSESPLSISIVDASGRKVFEQNVPKNDGVYESPLDLSKLPRGAYVLSVNQGEAVHSAKLLLQ